MSEIPPVYSAQLGSPFTVLAEDYTTGSDTMVVEDSTKLPNAPNIVCLAGDKSGEFSYSGKNGNNLIGVRVLPGTPNTTWSMGTFAFRGIAAYDVNSLQTRTRGLQTQINVITATNSPIVGIEWDTESSNPVLKHIDALGNELESLDVTFFDKHYVFGGRSRCLRNRATGEVTYGANPRGDGLILDGSVGDILVREPAFYGKFEMDDGTDLARWWVSARPSAGFSLHPYYYMRGNGIPASEMYSGAYESYGLIFDGEFRLGSASGKTPVTGGVDYPNLPNNGRFHIDDAELYASRISPGNAGCESFWGYCATQLLMYIEFGTFDIQTALGKGIVDLDSGSGYAGLLTGAHDIDTRIAENGTGTGSGVNGKTPVCWRGKENHHGHTWKFIIGANVDPNGDFRLIKRDGTGTLAGELASGSYEAGVGMATTEGYISGLLSGELEAFAFLPSSVENGADNKYLCDYFWPSNGKNRILRAGGRWSDALRAGPGFRHGDTSASLSHRIIGARVEIRGQKKEYN